MPNYVYNSLFVSGEPADLMSFSEQVGQPFVRGGIAFDTPEFSFWNIIRPASEEWYDSNENWYNWNITHWGTKWDTMEVHRAFIYDNGLLTSIEYSFTTAWAEPTPIFMALVDNYPNLDFSIRYQEEQGWGGEVITKQGVVAQSRSWDIPNSHADWEDVGEPECCPCWDNHDAEYWFDDCPSKQEYLILNDILHEMTPDEAREMTEADLLALGATTLAKILEDYRKLEPDNRQDFISQYV